MACVVATLKTGNYRCLFCQQINDLAFAFIAPLGT
jgi:hypothetical protein